MARTEIKPVYVLHGSDAFLRDGHRRNILKLIIGDSDPQTAITSFDATAELAEVLDELRTMPFLAPRRAVIVSDADAFISAHREPIERYLQSPSAASSLILIVSSWAKTTRLYKLVAKIGEAMDCSAPDARSVSKWLRSAAVRHGKAIAPDAAELLLAWRGADLAGLDSELEKLSVYVGRRESICLEDVSTLVTATAGPVAFALTNALTAGKLPEAMSALAGSVTRRGEEFKVLGMLGWHLRKALHTQQLIQTGTPPQQACTAAKVFYQKPEFLAMLRRRGLAGLQKDFRNLMAADLAMKTGTNATAALQELVVKLCM